MVVVVVVAAMAAMVSVVDLVERNGVKLPTLQSHGSQMAGRFGCPSVQGAKNWASAVNITCGFSARFHTMVRMVCILRQQSWN